MEKISCGYCQCGCGQKTRVPKTTSRAKGWEGGVPLRFIHNHHAKVTAKRGKEHYLWKGGRICANGRPRLLTIGHPKADKHGYVHEAIILAEKALEKYLPPKAQVHHHTPEQLVVCQDDAYHKLLHQRQRALRACGNASWRKCKFCKRYDTPEIISNGYHNQCRREYRQRRKNHGI